MSEARRAELLASLERLGDAVPGTDDLAISRRIYAELASIETVRTRRWWVFCWSLLAFEVLQVAVATTLLVMQ